MTSACAAQACATRPPMLTPLLPQRRSPRAAKRHNRLRHHQRRALAAGLHRAGRRARGRADECLHRRLLRPQGRLRGRRRARHDRHGHPDGARQHRRAGWRPRHPRHGRRCYIRHDLALPRRSCALVYPWTRRLELAAAPCHRPGGGQRRGTGHAQPRLDVGIRCVQPACAPRALADFGAQVSRSSSTSPLPASWLLVCSLSARRARAGS